MSPLPVVVRRRQGGENLDVPGPHRKSEIKVTTGETNVKRPRKLQATKLLEARITKVRCLCDTLLISDNKSSNDTTRVMTPFFGFFFCRFAFVLAFELLRYR